MLAELARERTAKHEAELRSLEAEYRNLQAQLNPHFLYNALLILLAMAVTVGLLFAAAPPIVLYQGF